MRITLITNCELPGGFVLHAETPAEELFLRQFGNDKRKVVANSGGNFAEGRVHLTVTHLTKRTPDAGDSAASTSSLQVSALSASEGDT